LKGREGFSPAVVETAAMAQTDRTNVYQDITDVIIADLERGCVPWAQP
jgi:antirestriction protein ArdC